VERERERESGLLHVAGKKFGYVKYADADSARRAVDVLHGEMICGNRMKVMIAEKPRYPSLSSSDKRKYPGDFDANTEHSSKRSA